MTFTIREAIVLALADNRARTLDQVHELRCDKQGLRRPDSPISTWETLDLLVKEGYVNKRPLPPGGIGYILSPNDKTPASS